MLYQQHDEVMKNLFQKYLEKNRLPFVEAHTFKDLLKVFKVTLLIYIYIPSIYLILDEGI